MRRVPGLLLVACAFGCVGTDDGKPGDDADSAKDSGDSGADSGDSTGSGAAPDRAPLVPLPLPRWSPGGDIPGWADADCPEPSEGRTYRTTFPDVQEVELSFLAGEPGPGPHRLVVRLRDCDFTPCYEHGGAPDEAKPFLEATLDLSGSKDGGDRGQGPWGPDAGSPRRVVARGNGPLIAWSNGGWGYVGEVTACLGRVRPDEVEGVIRAELPVEVLPWTPLGNKGPWYDTQVFRFPFEVHFAEHAGYDLSLPDTGTRPEDYPRAHVLYGVPYAEAWPWGRITQPLLRAQVQERYRPYNQP